MAATELLHMALKRERKHIQLIHRISPHGNNNFASVKRLEVLTVKEKRG